MDDLELQNIVRNEVEQATNHVDSEYSQNRIDAMNYYLGEKLGNEIDGRSQVISTDVSDCVEMIMPSLMRVFTASDDFCHFVPTGPEDEAAAEQCTDYINHILNKQNDGFVILHNWFKDSLLFKIGVVKHWYDESETVTTETYEGLSEDELTALLSDEDVEVLEQEARPFGAPPPDPSMPQPFLYDVKIRTTERDGKIKIENVPPEEFLFSQHAKSMEDARFTAHRTSMTVSDVIEMGYDRDIAEKYAGHLETDEEEQTRFSDLESSQGAMTSDISQREVLVTEVYLKVDYDDDGKAEMRRIVCLGPGYEVVENEPFYDTPFSVLSPILMPHRLVGRSVTDLLESIQVIKTTLLRQLLDNIYLMNNSRLAAVEGQVNLDDLTSSTPGGIVRMRAPGMVTPITVPSVGQVAIPLMEYVDTVKEQRTGMSKAAMGLDPKALQSTTATAVSSTVTAAQSKLEMIARVFAETGVKRLMRCLLELVQKHEQQPQIVRLRNQFVTVDPQAWKNGFDVTVDVGLGTGQNEQRVAVLQNIAAKQEEILKTTGVNNPLVTLSQYRNTLAKMIELSGFKDTSKFFMDPDNLPPEIQQKMQQAGQNQPPDPAMQKIQIARMEAEAAISAAREKLQAEIQLKREELQMKMQLRSEEMRMERELRGIEAVTKTNINPNLPRA